MYQHAKYFLGMLLVGLTSLSASGQVYRWDTGEVIPGTEHIHIIPGRFFYGRDAESKNLKFAEFSYMDLHDISYVYVWLHSARFIGANLTGARFNNAHLYDTDFSDAIITGTRFSNVTGFGFSSEQLYSTASYKSGELQAIEFWLNDLSGWSFANQDLSGALFERVELAGTDLSGANITSTTFVNTTGFTPQQLYATASYQAGNMQGLGLHELTLSHWDLSNQNLSGSSFYGSQLQNTSLVNANLNQADLTDVELSTADLTGANISAAILRGVTSFGFTAEKLYATASYQTGRLGDIQFNDNDMSGWSFQGQDLESSDFTNATLNHADLSQTHLAHTIFEQTSINDADLSGAHVNQTRFIGMTAHGLTAQQLYATASYHAGDLREIVLVDNNLNGWDFGGQDMSEAEITSSVLNDADLSNTNLSRVDFSNTSLLNANFAGAVINGTNFTAATGFSSEQLYATASYQMRDLSNVRFGGNMNGWDFADQYLVDADLSSATWATAELSRADLRGASVQFWYTPMLKNTIDPHGYLEFDLAPDETMLIRDYDGYYAIEAEYTFIMHANSTLKMLFEDGDWGSTITIELWQGALAELDGTLFLDFTEDADLASLVGTTYRLFDWNDQLGSGEVFAEVAWPTGFVWDISDLYIGGTVTLLAIPEPATVVLLALAALGLRRR